MNDDSKEKNSYFYLLIIVGILTAFAPFVTDFYLPALPTLIKYFDTNTSLVQMSLTMGIIGLAIGQLLVGPISDKYGRKKLLLISLSLFLLTTILCLLAPSILTFNICRLFQGMAASGGFVLSRSIASDSFNGKVLSKFLSIVTAINGIGPVLAPILGGFILKFTNWKGTFVALAIIEILVIILCFHFKETLPVEKRSPKTIISVFSLYTKVLKNKVYRQFLSIYAMSSFVLFAYISSSPFIFQTNFGFSPMKFSCIFGLNAFSIGIGCAVAGKIADDIKSLKIGGIEFMLAAFLVFFSLYFNASSLFVELSFLALLFGFGLLQPPAVAQTLMTERVNGGTASALMGALGFVMGSFASPLVGIGNVMTSSGIIILIATILNFLFVIRAINNKNKAKDIVTYEQQN